MIGWIKDSTGSYDVALTLVAAALIAGGLLGIAIVRTGVPALRLSKQ